MRIDMIVDESRLPKNTFGRIQPEMEKRVLALYPDAIIRVRKGENNNLSIMEKNDKAKEVVNGLLEEMFNEADEWLYNQ